MINMNNMNNQHDPHIVDIVTLGERGQIVIPAAIREHFNLEPGQKLAIFTKFGRMICLAPPDSLQSWVEEMTKQLANVERLQNGHAQTPSEPHNPNQEK